MARPPAVPALRRGLAALQFLASRPAPVSAAAVARELGIARSSAYELLGELTASGFVVHLPQSRTWGLGVAAFEIGSAYLRSQPLERIGTPLIRELATLATGLHPGATAHLGVLHGAQMLYLVKERAGRFGPTLVTDVGVRLPATLTATGLSLLAGLPTGEIRALFPDPSAFVRRTDRGPQTPADLRTSIAEIRARGWAIEHGSVSPDTASVAAAAVDHSGRPLAAVGITIRHVCNSTGCNGLDALTPLAAPALQIADRLTLALGGRRSRPVG